MRLDIDLVLRNETGNEIHTEEPISIHMNRKITRNEFEEDWNEQIKKEIKKGIMNLIKKANAQNQSSTTKCHVCGEEIEDNGASLLAHERTCSIQE